MSPLRYIHALRPVNLLMTVFIMVSMKYGMLDVYDDGGPDSPVFFWIYVFSVLCLMAFGYLVNDYYDTETDKINKPGKNIFVDAPARRIWVWGSVLVLLSLVPVFVSVLGGAGSLFFPLLLNITALVLLFIYAKAGKSTVLWGNLHIAFLGALLLVATFFASGEFFFHNDGNLKLLITYCAFSFLATLLREIVKDAEDVEGDARSGIKTLASKYGTSASRYVATAVNFFLLLLLMRVAWDYHVSNQPAKAIVFSVLAVYGIYTLFNLWYARDKAGFRRTSLALKLYMVLGILSMWL